jgi:tetratricopeptide (TPR) repeat protein
MSSSLTKGLRRSPTRSKAKRPAAKTAKRAVKAKPAAVKTQAKRASAAKPVARKTAKTAAKKTATKSKTAVKAKKAAPKPVARKAPAAKKVEVSRVKKTQKLAAVRAVRPIQAPPPPPRQPTQDESAALGAFERAHKEFVRGRFAEARNQFRVLVDKFSQVSEVAARARTYLAIAESRLRTESMLPRDADSLYDRGVIELNRGEYVAAQEMFERALKREPEAAHIHYGLAATRARLGSIDLALESLQRALAIQPNLRVRAQHDHDLNPLRNDPDFDRLIFSNPS